MTPSRLAGVWIFRYFCKNELSMSTRQALKVFEDKRIRTFWDDSEEKWFFSIADVVVALTDSQDVKQYVKRLRSRDKELGAVWGTICTPHNLFLQTENFIHLTVQTFRAFSALSSPFPPRRQNHSSAGLHRWEPKGFTRCRTRNWS